MRLRLIPEQTRVPFIRFRHIAVAISIAMMLASILLACTRGIHFGIDFRGGIAMQISPQTAVSPPLQASDVRALLKSHDLPVADVQKFGERGLLLKFQVTHPPVLPATKSAVQAVQGAANDADTTATAQLENVKHILSQHYVIDSTQIVGPQISSEFIKNGVLAVCIAIILMMFYIWFRFEWQFGIGAVVALLHDVLITIGVFSIFQLSFDLATIAALLTIVGYSMNDTVVVFDRIREDLRLQRQMPLPELVNRSINETLSRTLMTSGATLLSLLALLIFGGPSIRSFVFAMFFGIIVGTYSSIFIASPVVLAFGLPRGGGSPK